jgi:hypothetical protein
MSYNCRTPTLGDLLVYYGADALKSYVKSEVQTLRNKGELDLLSSLVAIFLYGGSGYVQNSLNKELCQPFQPLFDVPQNNQPALSSWDINPNQNKRKTKKTFDLSNDDYSLL